MIQSSVDTLKWYSRECEETDIRSDLRLDPEFGLRPRDWKYLATLTTVKKCDVFLLSAQHSFVLIDTYAS
jgi:hypothetical protein